MVDATFPGFNGVNREPAAPTYIAAKVGGV
jgi:hypothetical protein